MGRDLCGCVGRIQISRSAAVHADLVFSGRLVQALIEAPALRDHRGPLVLVAADSDAERFLRDSIGGYIPFVTRRALGPAAFTIPAPTVRLRCDYGGGRLTLHPL